MIHPSIRDLFLALNRHPAFQDAVQRLRTTQPGAPVQLSGLTLTAKALRNAHRFESLLRSSDDREATRRRAELERIALVAFLRRLLDRYTAREDHMWAETLLPRASDDELDRLVSVAMQVLEEEAKG